MLELLSLTANGEERCQNARQGSEQRSGNRCPVAEIDFPRAHDTCHTAFVLRAFSPTSGSFGRDFMASFMMRVTISQTCDLLPPSFSFVATCQSLNSITSSSGSPGRCASAFRTVLGATAMTFR